ncbi:MAG: acyltransferase [Bacteroidota bacterium]|nr:acyltransferase [Bacteroidota bacterium]
MKSKLSPGEKSKIYFPQLDSIRGISFIAIFLFHTLQVSFGGNFLGDFIQYLFANLPLAIDVFFILSSFLLTYLALNEYQKRGNFSFKNYFTRRVLRIWPLYYFILLMAFILFPFVANLLHYKMTLPEPVYYILFIANFYTINHVFFLKLLWTISVEEQFYLLWGFCLRFFHKHLYKIIFLLIFVSVSFSVYSAFTRSASYFNSLTYLFDFGCGALAGLLIFKHNFIVSRFKNFSELKTIFFYCYLPFHFIFFYILNENSAGISNDLVALVCRYLFIIYIALFIIEQMINIHRTKILERSRFLIFTGKISYGLYCYHGISIMFLNLLVEHFKLGISNWIMVLIYFSLNYLVATISYFYLESPFLKLKSKWRRI